MRLTKMNAFIPDEILNIRQNYIIIYYMRHIISFLTNNSSSILILNDGIALYCIEENTIYHEVMGMGFNLNEVRDFKWINENEFTFDTDEMSWSGRVAVTQTKNVVNG